MNPPTDSLSRLPERFRSAIESQLESPESVVAFFWSDLDDRLQFADGLVVLSSQRLLTVRKAQTPEAANSAAENPSDCAIQSWPLSSITSLSARDHGGLGHFEAASSDSRLASVYYTVGQAGGVRELIEAFDDLQSGRLRGGALVTAEPEVPEAAAGPERANVGALFRLLRFARNRIGTLLLGGLLTFATTSVGLIPYYFTKPIFDTVLRPFDGHINDIRSRLHDGQINKQQAEDERLQVQREADASFGSVKWYLAGMAGAIILAWGLGWAQGWVLAWLSERISSDLRNTTYEHLQRLSLDFFSAKRTGDLVARISSDTDRICNFLSDSLMDFVTDVLTIAATVGVLFWLDPWLAAATVCTFPLIASMTFYIRDTLTHGFLFASRAWADMTSVLADTIPGIRVVKAFAQERREVERFRSANDGIMAANDRVNRVWTFFWPMVALLNQVGLLVVWAVGSWGVYHRSVLSSAEGMSIGSLTMAMLYINRIYSRLESMSRMATTTQRAAASAQRLFEILDRVPSVPEPARPVDPGKILGAVELKDISFRYGNRQIIDGVSLQIRPGEMIGLVGTTGAGKSTLVNLVCRFYDVSDGAVLVDGVDVRSFRVADYRKHIGIVLQEPFLFYGTIAENIAYGRPRATHEEIIAAARAARAHEFILQLPDGYDSIVGERGQTLSGGERQRISIARALLIDPRILILDEATSSVDTQTERQIQEALDNLVRGRTTIAIAHRLSTLRQADRLIVLERGRIVEVGNHAELLGKGGAYARLYQAQMQLTQDPGETPLRPADPESPDDSR